MAQIDKHEMTVLSPNSRELNLFLIGQREQTPPPSAHRPLRYLPNQHGFVRHWLRKLTDSMASLVSLNQQVPIVRPYSRFQSRNNSPRFTLFVNGFLNRVHVPVSQLLPLKASLSSASVTNESEVELKPSTLRDICEGHVPEHVLNRMDEIGFVLPTDVQRQALPVLFSGRDCILHAQTGSGKTLTYLLLILSIINSQKSVVQALIVVPTRELGMQVTKVARMLAEKECIVMALLDGGMLRRHKSWLKAEPPAIMVATIGSLCQMLQKQAFKLDKLQVLVIDEVDYMFNSSKEVSSLKKLLTIYSSVNNRHTVLASASIPQHRRFLYDCIQQKWTKSDAVHIHVSAVEPMPSRIRHRYVICSKHEKRQTLLTLLQRDAPQSGIIFAGEQSEKSKRAGNDPSTTLLTDLLKSSYAGSLDIILLEEDMNFNLRASSLSDMRQGGGYLLVATDIAARGVDLPETTHIYNFDLPKTVVDYLHRAGRTSRKPFSDKECTVTTIVTSEERFVLQRFENELMFNCEELNL